MLPEDEEFTFQMMMLIVERFETGPECERWLLWLYDCMSRHIKARAEAETNLPH